MNRKLLLKKIGIYILGLLVMAVGTAFSMNSGLGASPVNSLPYTFSLISDLPMFWCVILINIVYVLVQLIVLRKVRLSQFCQIFFAIVFSCLLEHIRWLLGDLGISSYGGSLTIVIIGAFFVGIGVVLYTGTNLVPMPMEGLARTVVEKSGIKFSTMKNVVDCSSVGISLVLVLVFLGRLDCVREGTIISAFLVGRIVEFGNRFILKLKQTDQKVKNTTIEREIDRSYNGEIE